MKIARILGSDIGSLPATYLGLPLGNRTLDSFWNSIIDRFNKKLSGWKGSSLSQAGKCTLVKSIFQNHPTYALRFFGIVTKHVEIMLKIQRDFLWTRAEEHKRYHLVSWDLVCLPKCYGGLGIRKIRHLNNALLAKHIWRIFQSTRVWRDILIEKYLRRQSLNFLLAKTKIPQGSYLWNNILKAKFVAKSKAK